MNETKKIPPSWDSSGEKQCRGQGEIRIVKRVTAEGFAERMTSERRLEERGADHAAVGERHCRQSKSLGAVVVAVQACLEQRKS